MNEFSERRAADETAMSAKFTEIGEPKSDGADRRDGKNATNRRKAGSLLSHLNPCRSKKRFPLARNLLNSLT